MTISNNEGRVLRRIAEILCAMPHEPTQNLGQLLRNWLIGEIGLTELEQLAQANAERRLLQTDADTAAAVRATRLLMAMPNDDLSDLAIGGGLPLNVWQLRQRANAHDPPPDPDEEFCNLHLGSEDGGPPLLCIKEPGHRGKHAPTIVKNMSQACGLYEEHARCSGEATMATTLDTLSCRCPCHAS